MLSIPHALISFFVFFFIYFSLFIYFTLCPKFVMKRITKITLDIVTNIRKVFIRYQNISGPRAAFGPARTYLVSTCIYVRS